MEKGLKVDIMENNDHILFGLKGNIDAHSETSLNEIVNKANKSVAKFDFTNTDRINSMGVALLLKCFKQLKEEKNINIQIYGLNRMNAMLFKMTGIFLLASPGQ